MPYTKQTWEVGSYVNPTRMNHIEDGIEDCANLIGWTNGGTGYSNWNYYKDSEGYWHLHYYESTAVSRTFSTSEGSIYRADNVTIGFPETVGSIVSINANVQQGASACGVTVASIASNQVILSLWSPTSGAKNIRLSISIIAKGVTA